MKMRRTVVIGYMISSSSGISVHGWWGVERQQPRSMVDPAPRGRKPILVCANISQPDLPPLRRQHDLFRELPVQVLGDGLEVLGVVQVDVGRDPHAVIDVVDRAIGKENLRPAERLERLC